MNNSVIELCRYCQHQSVCKHTDTMKEAVNTMKWQTEHKDGNFNRNFDLVNKMAAAGIKFRLACKSYMANNSAGAPREECEW